MRLRAENGAVHLLPPRCYCRRPKGGARHGLPDTTSRRPPPAPEAAGPTDPNQAVARDRRVDRTEDLNEDEIAAVEASEMEARFRASRCRARAGRDVCGRGWRRLRPKTSGARRCRQGTAGRQGVSRQPVRRFLTAIAPTRGSPGPKSTGRAGDFVFRKGKAPQHGGLSGRSGAQARRFPGFRTARIADLRADVQHYR